MKYTVEATIGSVNNHDYHVTRMIRRLTSTGDITDNGPSYQGYILATR